ATPRQRIGALVSEARRRQRTLQLEDELLAGCEFEGLVGNSPLMWDMFSKIRRIAPHYRTVLVTGETGMGKDLVARAAPFESCDGRPVRGTELLGSGGDVI